MSDSYGYGIANPEVQDPVFAGEMPLPESIYANDPGISNLKANADHSHAIDLGGVDTPWQTLLLALPVVPLGGSYRVPQYCRMGNLVFVRGVVNCSAYGGGFALVLGYLPTGYYPKTYNEISSGYGGIPHDAYRIEFANDGRVILVIGPSANPGYLSLGNPTAVICVD